MNYLCPFNNKLSPSTSGAPSPLLTPGGSGRGEESLFSGCSPAARSLARDTNTCGTVAATRCSHFLPLAQNCFFEQAGSGQKLCPRLKTQVGGRGGNLKGSHCRPVPSTPLPSTPHSWCGGDQAAPSRTSCVENK